MKDKMKIYYFILLLSVMLVGCGTVTTYLPPGKHFTKIEWKAGDLYVDYRDMITGELPTNYTVKVKYQDNPWWWWYLTIVETNINNNR